MQALCTSRAGGVSAAPYDSLNLGDHVGDLPEDVHTNRKRLQTALQAHLPAAQAVFLRQVHGTHTVDLDAGLSDGICADACVATMPAKVCTIMVADCLPVLLTDLQGRAVAAAHAGWRGLADGVLESVFDAFCTRLLHETTPANRWALAQSTLAWLGPCIGPLAFEVGEEVRAAFCAHDSRAALHFQPQTDRPGKYLADLAALARQRLQALGIRQISGNDSTSTWCTVGNPSRFFSHRRDAIALGGSGRMAVCVWRHGGV
ncbi:purine nucleoside phosphorylase YfiH [Giesbergeria sinuosa]